MVEIEHRLRILETVMSNVDSLISYMDTNLVYLYVNKSYSRWFGLAQDECLGRTMNEVVGDDAVKSVRPYLDAVLRGETQEFETEVHYKHRGRRSIHVRYLPDLNAEGHVVGIIVIVTDTTAFVERSRQFQDIYDVSPLGIAIFDEKARFLDANQAYQEMLGYSEAELRQLTVADVTYPDDVNMTPEAIQRSLANRGDYQRFEKRYVAKEGRVLSVRITARVITNDSRSVRFMALCEDITSQKQSEDELNRVNEVNQAIIRSATSAIITTDLRGIITAFNSAAEAMLGYASAEVIGRRTPDSFHVFNEIDEAAERLSKKLGRRIDPTFDVLTFNARKGGFEEREWTLERADGSRFPARVTMTGLYDSQKKLTGFLATIVDLTETRELQKQLENERAKATHISKLASLGEMSAGIAHEINNPLGIMLGTLPLLEKFKNEPDRFARKLDNMAGAGKRIEKIVKGLKRFSRTTQDSEHKLASLNEIINEALTMTEATSKRHSTAVTACFSGTPMLVCDSVEIEQILVNLINNSVDAVKEQAQRWVRIEVLDDDRDVLVYVRDSGAGISPLIEEKIFVPFFTTKPVGEGTGLGLSIAKGIVESHQGSLRLDRSSTTTCFELRIPKLGKNTNPSLIEGPHAC